MPLLEVKDLMMHFTTRKGDVKAVDGVSFALDKGAALGIAGESGCGKTSLAITLLRLLPKNGRIVGGEVLFEERNILELPEERFRKEIRWKGVSMVFQGALNALNPVHTVGRQISEAIRTHIRIRDREVGKRVAELFHLVGLDPTRAQNYPHEFSGGMKQRAVIAMALAANPKMIIADEPTTALDVIVQAQVLQALEGLRQDLGIAMALITHDLSIIAQTCDDVAVFYAGRIAEYGGTIPVYQQPLHPYTQGLVGAFPDVLAERQPIVSIPGAPPDLVDPPPGCRFHPRCRVAEERCAQVTPAPEEQSSRKVACHLAEKIAGQEVEVRWGQEEPWQQAP